MRLESGVPKKINILGTTWTVIVASEKDYPELKRLAGYADSSTHEIVVGDMANDSPDSKRDLSAYRDRVVRHEVIHAFLAESGLDGNGKKASHWEHNEEMVDWMAIQFPKITNVFMELGVL